MAIQNLFLLLIFTDEREVRYSVISGFVFLRFFAPAILHPKLFDLTSEQIVSVIAAMHVELSADKFIN